MAASVAHGGRYNAPSGAGSGLMYIGTWAPVTGDFYASFMKWQDVSATIDFYDDQPLTWTKRTARLHTAGGSNLRMQMAYAANVPAMPANSLYAGPTTSVDKREAVTYLFRGVTTAAPVSADNVAYAAAATALTLTGCDPGSSGGITVGFFAWDTPGLTPTAGAGWTLGPDIFSSKDRTCMVYKVTTGAGSQAPSITLSGSANIMGTSFALAAIAAPAPTSVTGYLEATAVGRTVTVLLWAGGDPSTENATKYLSVPLIAATDPGGAAAAQFTVTPAPTGTTNGQTVLAAAFDPANQDASSYGFPAVVSA